MKLVKNLFSIIGVLTLVVTIVLLYKLEPSYHVLKTFDKSAASIYSELMDNILKTGNAAEATVWKVQVEEGLTIEEVEETMKFVANEHNIKNVGELPLSQQIEAMSEKPYRYMRIFMFCNALTAAKMVDYNDAFSAYLPCRITLLEDKKGKLWLFSLNMDLMIYGGKPLPSDLKEEALRVKTIIREIMIRSASGEF